MSDSSPTFFLECRHDAWRCSIIYSLPLMAIYPHIVTSKKKSQHAQDNGADREKCWSGLFAT